MILPKLTGSVLNTAINAKRELSKIISEQITKILKNHDFVSREEFEVIKKNRPEYQARI